MKERLLVEGVKGRVREVYEKLDEWPHGWPHVESVTHTIRGLGDTLGLSGEERETYALAAYCHDLGRLGEQEAKKRAERSAPHAYLSVAPTRRILRESGVPEGERLSRIIHTVRVHSDWHYEGNEPMAKTLIWADRKDSLGAWGLLRTAQWHLKRFGLEINPPRCDDTEGIMREAKRTRGWIRDESRINPEIEHVFKRLLGFVLEWEDDERDEVQEELTRREFKYTKEAREELFG